MAKFQVIIELSGIIECEVSGQNDSDGAISIAQDWLIGCEKEIERTLRNNSSAYGISFTNDSAISFGLDESAQVYDMEDDEEDEDLDDEEPEENLFRFG